MNTLEKIARTALVHHFENFQNHEYLFTTAKSPAQMAEKTGNKKKNTGNYKALRVLRKRKNNMAWRAGLIWWKKLKSNLEIIRYIISRMK